MKLTDAQGTKNSSDGIETRNGLGAIKISENVFETIVRKAILSVDGVTRLAGGTLANSIASIIGSQKMTEHGAINLEVDENGLNIEIKLNVYYGVNIPQIAADIQNVIGSAINLITGIPVGSVSIIVQDLEKREEVVAIKEKPAEKKEDEGENGTDPE